MMINASAPQDEVWVGEGVYTPTHLIAVPMDNNQQVDRRSTFTVHSGVKLYGGFPNSGSPGMEDRDFDLYPSILSGDIGVPGDSTDNCFHVMFFPATSDAVVNGFTITSGTANGSTATANESSYVSALFISIPNYRGGGIYMHNASNIQIENCTFAHNRSTYDGGALYIAGGSHEFSNCRFTRNIGGGHGGAIHAREGAYSISNSIFEQNRVVLQSGGGPFPMPTPGYWAYGGAIYIQNGELNLMNNQFIENTGFINVGTTVAEGGAVYITGGSHTILNNSFIRNASLQWITGTLLCTGGAITIDPSASSIIEGNTFTENSTHGSGGALSMAGGPHVVAQNRFTANDAFGYGGAMACSGSTIDVVNNIFELNNTQGIGGAIRASFDQGTNRYVNNTFYANTSGTEGGAIYLDTRVDHMLNNIFWANMASNSTSLNGPDVRFFNSSSSTLFHNLLQNEDAPSNGNVMGWNPQFADAANGDYTLLSSSPCINAGANEHYMGTYSTEDYSGNPRIFGDVIDMGALESQSAPNSAVCPTHYRHGMEVYPNPVESGSVLTIHAAEQGLIRMYDVTGKLCIESLLVKGSNALPVILPPGVYVGVHGDTVAVKLVVK